MRLLGFELSKAATIDQLRRKLRVFDEGLDITRPAMDRLQQLGGDGVRVPYYPLPPRTLQDAAFYCDTLATILAALRREVFREGIEVVDDFALKCTSCGKEFDQKPEEEACDCGGSLREPDIAEKEAFEEWSKSVNENKQSLQDVLELIENDLDVLDDAFLLFLKDYERDADGRVTNSTIRELLRGEPLLIRLIADKTGRPGRQDEGKPVYTCIDHRTLSWVNRSDCATCGLALYQAFFKADNQSAGAYSVENVGGVYYIEGEVFHRSKFHPSLTYGSSNVVTCWQKVATLIYQDAYIKEFYGKERPPRGILFINTQNMPGLQKQWEAYTTKVRTNPHDIHPVGVEFPKDGGKMVEWVDFSRPLDEMQYIETRNEYRKAIGALWGVMPLFQADIQQSGGLNNEGLQVTVTNRAVESGQQVINKFLLEVGRQWGLQDHTARLKPAEVKDQMSELLLEGQKGKNALDMRSLGFDVALGDDGEFEFAKGENSPPQAPYGAASPLPLEVQGSGSPARPEAAVEGVKGEREDSRYAALELAREMFDDGKARAEVVKAVRARFPKLDYYDVEDVADDAKSVSVPELKAFLLDNTPEEPFAEKSGAESLNERALSLRGSLFKERFKDVSKTKSDKAKSYILKAALRKRSLEDVAKAVATIAGVDAARADVIARTETHEVRLKARELNYLQAAGAEKALYRWVGPADYRTTPICKAITARSEGGLSLDALKTVIGEESRKAGLEPREFTPHFSCRHTFVRVYD